MSEKQYGILFDLDGTLWDSSDAVVKAWNTVLDKYADATRKATTEWMQRLMGKTMLDIENIFLDYLSPARRHELMLECMEYENEGYPVRRRAGNPGNPEKGLSPERSQQLPGGLYTRLL